MRSLGKTVPLDEFMFRRKLASVYRDLARTIYRTHERADLMQHVRAEFRANDALTDLTYRKYLLDRGIRQIEQMAPLLVPSSYR